MQKALFLDRDGIINIDKGYIHKSDDIEFVPGIFELLSLAKLKGYQLFVVTNQAGIARGLYDHHDVKILHDWMKKQFEDNDIEIKEFFYCPHHPDFSGECECRKPAPAMINNAIKRFGIDPSQSIIIGDKPSDVQAGKNAGLKTCILVSGQYVDHKVPEADIFVQNLAEAIQYIRENF